MDDLLRQVSHLTLLSSDMMAQESLNLGHRITDALDYYFSRFSRNLTHVFSDFASSEIADTNERHKRVIQSMFREDIDVFKSTIVPIPKGMVKSYFDTVNDLITILHTAGYETIKLDVLTVEQAVTRDTPLAAAINMFSQEQFGKAKADIGKLFSTKGLTHDVATHAFTTMPELVSTNTRLLNLTKSYPDILVINDSLKKMEIYHKTAKWSDEAKKLVTPLFLTLAYRLSIIAVVMEHVQAIEHQFASTLNILIKTYNKR